MEKNYNSKKLIELPESQWIIVKNTHEPIVSQELFDKAQIILNKAKKYREKKLFTLNRVQLLL